MKTGAGTEYLLQNDAANTGNNATVLGGFSLSSAGVLSVTTVPEPSTWAMVGSGMLALLAIRRRKQSIKKIQPNNINQQQPDKNIMKKTLILILAIGIACAMTTMADTYDLFLTGSTAFRANVHDACKGLFDTTPTTGAGTLQYGASSSGGNGAANNGNAQWTMSGTCASTISSLGTNKLVIHALFTGSVQGIQTVENSTKLIYLKSDGSLMTNSPTIAFSDCASSSTIYDANNTANFTEEKVCVQPFVWVRAMNGNPLMTNINNITWEQGRYIISAGRMKLSAWTTKSTDTNLIYILERTQDSGTRRVELACNGYGYNQGMTIYNYDVTNNAYYQTNNTISSTSGGLGIGIIGAPGNGNNNLTWGSGYVGGGDLRTALNVAHTNNYSIGYLSFADAKTAGIANSNWSAVIPFNGIWPTAAGSGIWGNTGTNDFSPITRGLYSGYGDEVLICPADGVDASSISADQNLTFTILGNDTTPGTILGIFNKKFTNLTTPTTPTIGSLEYTIELSKPTGATAIRNYDMHTSRPSVGGLITP